MPVLVYDPLIAQPGPAAGGWSADYVFLDWAAFSRCFWASTGCYCVVDEAGSVCAKHETALELRAMLQRGRHRGHCLAIASQRYTDIDKTAREQCTRLFAFTQSRTDAKALADEWVCDELERLNELPPLHYYAVTPGRPPIRAELRF